MAGKRLTKQEIREEILKCGKDPEYFLNNYCKIAHPLRGLIPFDTFPYQDDVIRAFIEHRFNIILKARQLGLSTIVAGYCAWMLLFNRNKEILVVATKLDTSRNLVKKVKTIFKHLPIWIKISNITIDNRNSFELDNGSQIKATSSNPESARSEALSLLIVDEAAHVERLNDIWTAALPTLSTGGRCIVLSTPKGAGSWFHKTYIEAMEEKNTFNPIVLPWDVHPERDQAWFENETKNMTKRDIAQELLCSFNMSGETVFDPEDIERISNEIMEPVRKVGFDRNLWIWEDFQEDSTYLISADVARGDGKDYSVFHVLKAETMELVAEYQGRLTPDIFSDLLLQSGKDYGNCMIVVEANSIGFHVLEKLREAEYPNIYCSKKTTHAFVEQFQAEQRSDVIFGFTSSQKTRPLVISKMEEFVRNKILKIYSKRLLNEMNTFIWNNSRPESMRSYNDDLIIACAIGCWVKDTALDVDQRDVQYKKAFMNSIVSVRSTMNTAIPGMRGYRRDPREEIEKKKKEMNEFLWIYKG